MANNFVKPEETWRAIGEHRARLKSEINLLENETYEMVDNSKEGDWIRVKNKNTKEIGFAPR